MRMNEDDFVQQEHEGSIEGEGVIGRPLVKQISIVDECCREVAGEGLNIVLTGNAG